MGTAHVPEGGSVIVSVTGFAGLLLAVPGNEGRQGASLGMQSAFNGS
jgi:hypothetical protein